MTEWLAYYTTDPWDGGPRGSRGDLRAGIIAATIANANKGKDGDPFTPHDFMPKYKSAREQKMESVRQQMGALDLMNSVMGRPTLLEENKISEVRLKEDS